MRQSPGTLCYSFRLTGSPDVPRGDWTAGGKRERDSASAASAAWARALQLEPVNCWRRAGDKPLFLHHTGSEAFELLCITGDLM